MKTPSLFVCTLAYRGRVTVKYFHGMWESLAQLSDKLAGFEPYIIPDQSFLAMARNICVARFLKTKHTHLLFIDEDHGWKPQVILSLLARDVPLISGCYPKKGILWPAVDQAVKDGKLDRLDRRGLIGAYRAAEGVVESKDGLLECTHVPTGFLLIRRDCIEQMIAAYPTPWFLYAGAADNKELHCHALFWNGVRDNIIHGEDYEFCERYREIGGKVWLDLTAQVSHVGTYTYGGE